MAEGENAIIDWEYPDGRGGADFHCAAVYRAKYKHRFTREDLIEAMKTSKDVMEKFMEHRTAAIQKARKKHCKGTC